MSLWSIFISIISLFKSFTYLKVIYISYIFTIQHLWDNPTEILQNSNSFYKNWISILNLKIGWCKFLFAFFNFSICFTIELFLEHLPLDTVFCVYAIQSAYSQIVISMSFFLHLNISRPQTLCSDIFRNELLYPVFHRVPAILFSWPCLFLKPKL